MVTEWKIFNVLTSIFKIVYDTPKDTMGGYVFKTIGTDNIKTCLAPKF